MGDDELIRLYRRANKHARLKGWGDWADDFASHYIICLIEGKAKHQIIGYALIDFLRQEFNNLRKVRFNLSEQLLVEAPGYCVEDRVMLFDLIKKHCTLIERKILHEYLINGLTMKEVGNVFNRNESRISQMISKLVTKINTKKPNSRRGIVSYQDTITVKGGNQVQVFKKKPSFLRQPREVSAQDHHHELKNSAQLPDDNS